MKPDSSKKPAADPIPLPLAILAGWVLPGLGHALTGHVRRGTIAGATCMVLFFAGLIIGGIDAVDWRNDTLWFAGQALIGPTSIVVAYTHDKLDHDARGRYRPPQPKSATYEPPYEKSIGRANELGTLYCALAGVLNLLIILDLVGRTDPEPDAESTPAAASSST